MKATAHEPGTVVDSLRQNPETDIDWADPAARRAELDALVTMAREMLAVTVANPDWAEAAELLGRIVDQNVDDQPPDGAPRTHAQHRHRFSEDQARTSLTASSAPSDCRSVTSSFH